MSSEDYSKVSTGGDCWLGCKHEETLRNHSAHFLQNCYPLYRKMTSRVCNLVNFRAEEESSRRWPFKSRSLLLQFQCVFSCSRQSSALTQFPERPNSASEVEQSSGNLSPQKEKYLGNMKQSEQGGFLPPSSAQGNKGNQDTATK